MSLARSARSHSCLSAAEAVDRLLTAFAGKTATRRQVLDANQLQKLSLTLGRRTLDGCGIAETPPLPGTPVPPGWHLVYFTPDAVEAELGPDGTDRSFNAPPPFTRRMWAGGSMTWPDVAAAGLRVGDRVEERTQLRAATAKTSRSGGGEMVLVDVVKEFEGPRGVGVIDERSWIFRPEAVPDLIEAVPERRRPTARGPSTIQDLPGDGAMQRSFCWSPVGLFRFSALTFNGHKIHYNDDWTRRVEGHPAEVVHGPLNLINVLDYWRDLRGSGAFPQRVDYRATAPIYAGETYVVKMEAADGPAKSCKVVVEKEGKACFVAHIA